MLRALSAVLVLGLLISVDVNALEAREKKNIVSLAMCIGTGALMLSFIGTIIASAAGTYSGYACKDGDLEYCCGPLKTDLIDSNCTAGPSTCSNSALYCGVLGQNTLPEPAPRTTFHKGWYQGLQIASYSMLGVGAVAILSGLGILIFTPREQDERPWPC